MRSTSAWLTSYPISVVMDAMNSTAGAIILFSLLGMAGSGVVLWADCYGMDDLAAFPFCHFMMFGLACLTPMGLILAPALLILFHQFIWSDRSKFHLSMWIVAAHMAMAISALAALQYDTQELVRMSLIAFLVVLSTYAALWGFTRLIRRVLSPPQPSGEQA